MGSMMATPCIQLDVQFICTLNSAAPLTAGGMPPCPEHNI